jgi:hypothetical protein
MTGTDTNATAQAPDDGVMGMDEAPERIWVDIALVDSPLKRSVLASNLCTADYSRAMPSDTEYVRADILAQTLAANAALVKRLEEARGVIAALEKAASEVARYGAATGPQWTRLTVPVLQARAFLAGGE